MFIFSVVLFIFCLVMFIFWVVVLFVFLLGGPVEFLFGPCLVFAWCSLVCFRVALFTFLNGHVYFFRGPV